MVNTEVHSMRYTDSDLIASSISRFRSVDIKYTHVLHVLHVYEFLFD